jgi:hypothetical protein
LAAIEITTAEDSSGVQTLDAGTVDTVTIAAGTRSPKGQGPRDRVRVIGLGDDHVYVTFDGRDPAADGTVGFLLPAGAVAERTHEFDDNEGIVVKVRSATAATYSVEVD